MRLSRRMVAAVALVAALGCGPEQPTLPTGRPQPAAVAPGHDCCAMAGVATRTEWVPARDRKRLQAVDLSYVDQDGRRGVVRDLLGRFVVLTFFYTRCDNAAKCSAAVTRLAELQQDLGQGGLAGDVRLVAATYEPAYDSPDRLLRFGTHRGLRFGEGAVAILIDSPDRARLLAELEVPVSFQGGLVNTHGVQLSILDREGRLARQYHTVMWDVASVLADLNRLKAGG